MSTAQEMVALIRRRGIYDPRLLEALEQVPRHEFVPDEYRAMAYGDHPLPIGHGQTISQPYIVALMTDLLNLRSGDRVLEIGTGSGYQAAILAAMGMDVYSVERLPALYEAARTRLASLGYDVHLRLGDGYEGWPEFAPYRGIIVTAAAPHIPPPLLEQLAEGGHLVIPQGAPHHYQSLRQIVKRHRDWQSFDWGDVTFVPFIHADP